VERFVRDVIRETAALFPGTYIHIGADESNKTSKEDYKTFICLVEKIIAENGKKMIGWEEVRTVKQDTATLVQAWNAGAQGNILSYCPNLYLDHPNKKGDTSTMSWCAPDLPLKTVYSTPLEGNWIGVEATLFGEFVQNPFIADRQLFPRLMALAEISWAPSNSNFGEFRKRIGASGARLDCMGIHWYATRGIAWQREP